MFDEMTPVKACGDFNYHVSDISGTVFVTVFSYFGFLFFSEIMSDDEFFLWKNGI